MESRTEFELAVANLPICLQHDPEKHRTVADLKRMAEQELDRAGKGKSSLDPVELLAVHRYIVALEQLTK